MINDPELERMYQLWKQMCKRCRDPRNKDYQWYGARGIAVCDRWLSNWRNFLADMGMKPPGMTLDRIYGNQGYSKDNCRWVTRREQTRNRTTCFAIEVVKDIKRRLKAGERQVDIARRYKAKPHRIAMIANGSNWADIQP